MIQVDVSDMQALDAFAPARLVTGVRRAFEESPYNAANISLAIVTDRVIRDLNRRYLNHDYETDVLSFVLDDSPPQLTGEIVVSADTAAREAVTAGWSLEDELLLYCVHGALHLIGYRDKTPHEANEMEARQLEILTAMGVRRTSQFEAGKEQRT